MYWEMHNSKSPGMQTQTLLHLWTSRFPSKLVSSSSVKSGSLNVTFLRELVLMLALRPRLGLCSGLERECAMTGEGSVAAGHTSHDGDREVEGFEPPHWRHPAKTNSLFCSGRVRTFHTQVWQCTLQLCSVELFLLQLLIITNWRINLHMHILWWWLCFSETQCWSIKIKKPSRWHFAGEEMNQLSTVYTTLY